MSAARLPECDDFFGFDRCFIDVESKSNSVGRVEVIRLSLERRFQEVQIDLAKNEILL